MFKLTLYCNPLTMIWNGLWTQKCLESLKKLFLNINVDLFASRINHRLDQYETYHPGPKAMATDTFSLEWFTLYAYIFAPFSVIEEFFKRCKKIRQK